MSEKVKIGWEKAAEVLRDISSVHDDILQGQASNKKEDEIVNVDLKAMDINRIGTGDLGNDDFVDSEDFLNGKRKTEKNPTYYNCRDKKGRWEATDINTEEVKSFKSLFLLFYC